MSDWRVRSGVMLGLAASLGAAAAGWLRTPPPGLPPLPAHGPLLSECDGAIESLVIQYVPEAASICGAAYRSFLGQLPPEVTVHVVCPDRAAFHDLRSRVGAVPCRLVPVCVGHAMSCWSRDRWLAFAPAHPAAATLLLSPREEAGESVWEARGGDRRIGDDLAKAFPDRVASRRSGLAFDGGDFVADGETVFVTPEVPQRNAGDAAAARLQESLAETLKRPVAILPEAPPHHAAMFLTLPGNRTAVVGDPSLARALPRSVLAALIDRPDFSPATQRLFDAAAATCAAHGYRVVRVPTVPDEDGRTYLTYVNVILDQRHGVRTVYLPAYRGAEALNDAASAVWRGLGYEVRPVDCTAVYRHFGALHCLVNVLRRSSRAESHART